MSAPKYITVDNYKQFKPSEFIHSFISDIETVEKLKMTMDMSSWTSRNDCLPCLGAIACMNMGFKLDAYGYTRNSVARRTSRIGNGLRRGFADDVRSLLQELYGIDIGLLPYTSHITRVKTKEQFRHLKRQVMIYVKALRKQGL